MTSLDVIYEDNHLLIVNKPAGMPVQEDKTEDECLLDVAKGYLKKKYEKPGAVFCEVTHRIDRPVSGLVVFARTSKALARMNEMFRDKEVKKMYFALVKDTPPFQEDHVTHWLKRNTEKNVTRAYPEKVKDSQQADLFYKIAYRVENNTLLYVHPFTGRTHQIRCQLSAIGCPIIGDVKYGYRNSNSDRSICLHARQLDFIHPVKKEPISVAAPLPNNEFWNKFKDLVM